MLVSAIYLIAAAFSVIQQYSMTRIAQGAVYQLRKDFVEKMARQPVSYYDSHQNGDIMARMVNDMDNIQGTLNQSLIQLVNSAMSVIGGIKVASGSVSLGDVQAILQYTNQFSQPITQIANLTNTIQATAASAERIFQVLDEPEMTELTPVAPITTDDILTFEHVAFSYQSDQPSMTDYSMSVKPVR